MVADPKATLKKQYFQGFVYGYLVTMEYIDLSNTIQDPNGLGGTVTARCGVSPEGDTTQVGKDKYPSFECSTYLYLLRSRLLVR